MYMENEESVRVLAERCQRVGYIIKTASEDQELEEDERMLKAIEDLKRCVIPTFLCCTLFDNLASTIKSALKEMEKKRARSRGRKLLHVFEDADEITTLDLTLTQFIAEFHVSISEGFMQLFQSLSDTYVAPNRNYIYQGRQGNFAMGQGR